VSTLQRLKQLQLLRIRRINLVRMIKDTILIILGVGAAAFGLKGFLLPNRFLDGGVMGISLLVNILSGINLSVLVVLINLPLL
jgi:uncharacterized membrane-anchored protein YitT (DUF2179 family)